MTAVSQRKKVIRKKCVGVTCVAASTQQDKPSATAKVTTRTTTQIVTAHVFLRTSWTIKIHRIVCWDPAWKKRLQWNF